MDISFFSFELPYNFLSFGVLMIIFGLGWALLIPRWSKEKSKENNLHTANGFAKILGITEEKEWLEDNFYRMVYRYTLEVTDQYGNLYTILTRPITDKLGFIGSSFPIKYNPRDPSDILFKSDEFTLKASYVMTVIGWILFVIGVVLVYFHFKT